jgi:hypothetical protein
MRTPEQMAQIEALARKMASRLGCYNGVGPDDEVLVGEPRRAPSPSGTVIIIPESEGCTRTQYWRCWFNAARVALDIE